MSGASISAIHTINRLLITKKVTSSWKPVALVRCFSVTPSRNMKLIQFTYKNNPQEVRVGFVEGDQVVDINRRDSSLPTTLLEILRNGCMDKVKTLSSKSAGGSIPLSNVILKAPITGMDKVLCIGLNYKDHCKEQNLTPPTVPMIFSKFASCVVGPSEPVRLRTGVTRSVDYEVELAAVIGKRASNVKAAHAHEFVLGYTVAQDVCARDWKAKNGGQLLLSKKVDWEVEQCIVIGKTASNVKAKDAMHYVLGATVAQDISARDWQKERNGGQFLLGKAQDSFCPIGPWIVTLDELGDPQCLDIQCSINGVLKQKSNTDQLVHKVPDVIERLSSVMTLLPGDILLTGTPGGVGMYRSPPEYLQPGDVICSHIDKIGMLETHVEQHCS